MSTKIYDGFIVRDLTKEQLLAEFAKVAELMLAQAKHEFLESIAKVTIRSFDIYRANILRGNDVPRPPHSFDVRDDYFVRMAKLKEKFAFRDSQVDWDMSISYAKHGDVWMAIPFWEKASMLAILEACPWHEPFGYWNNTDQPKGVTEEEWKERCNLWDQVIPSGIPDKHMDSFSCVNNDQLRINWFKDDDLQRLMPSKESRIESLLLDILQTAFFKDEQEKCSASLTYFSIGKAMSEFHERYQPSGDLWSRRDEFISICEQVVGDDQYLDLFDPDKQFD